MTQATSPLVTFTVAAAPDPTIPAWASGATLNAWTPIANNPAAAGPLTSNSANSVGYLPSPGGTNNYNYVVNGWGGIASSATGDVYMFGGGHGNYAGNEIYCLHLNQATPSWERINNPATPISGAQYYADGTPCSRHTYSSLWVAGGYLKSLGGAFNWPNAGNCSYVDVFDLSSRTWQTQVSANGGNWAACGDHATGVIYGVQKVSGNTQFISLSAANAWSVLGTSPVSGDFMGAAFDSGRNRIYRIGSYDANTPVDYWQIGSGRSDAALTGSAVAAFDGAGSYAAVDYDSTNQWILYKPTAGSTVYRLNCATLVCDTLPTTGSTSAVAEGAVCGRFKYVPNLKGFIYIPTWGVAYFLRTA